MDRVVPVDEEFIFEGNTLISQTDTEGIITFANRNFCEVSGYSADELINKSHNIIRHPTMPKAIFEKMWNSISTGHIWNGLIKNLRKDGSYYWTEAEILPIENKSNEITGYIAVRRQPSRKNIEETQALYNKMLED